MLSPANVATPFTAATAAVPDSVPLPALVPIATVTPPVKAVTTLPSPSSALTATAGAIAAPAVALLGWTVNASCVAVPGVMLKAALVTPVTPVAFAVSVYPLPVLLMLRLEKVATPLTAARLTVPESVPALGLAPSATVTLPLNPVAVFPWASCAVTCTAGEMGAPAPASLGCTVNASWVALPAMILKPELVAPVRPVPAAVSVYPVPVLSMLSPENVATPETAITVVVPASVPPPAFVPIVTVTLPVKPVAVLPCASRAVTLTAGATTAPAVVFVGCTVNAIWVAVPGVMLKPALVTPESPVAAPVSV